MTVNLDIIKTKLCKAIDSEGKVLENSTVLEIITQLHSLDITTEELERTRLGKFVNLIRKNTSEPDIANKARSLVKKWKKLVIGAKPEIANGFRRNAKKQRSSRESTPIREMGPRAETPVYFQDNSSRESTPHLVTNGHGPGASQSDPQILESSADGVQYNDSTYSWTQSIPIQSSERDSEPPRYVVLPYVCLD
ncbi:hypothetical protein ACHWQZ_G013815 [Mnemiopsis leidyi]